MYKVIYKFADLQDKNHVYNVGDTYPREGSNPSEERIAELASSNNKIGKPLIQEVIQKVTPPPIEEEQAKPIVEEVSKPKRGRRKKSDDVKNGGEEADSK